MDFEWNSHKAESNIKKHGVSFAEAVTVFRDYFSLAYPDPFHSVQESRYIMVGLSSMNRLLVVAHTYRNDTARIISARQATKREKDYYESRR